MIKAGMSEQDIPGAALQQRDGILNLDGRTAFDNLLLCFSLFVHNSLSLA
jgi:hypothetical protein